MEDKVTQFGNIAHNIVDRIENAVDAISRIDGCKEVFLATKAEADLGSLERACMKGLSSPWVVEGTLLNLVEIGMCGYIFEMGGIKANALANKMKRDLPPARTATMATRSTSRWTSSDSWWPPSVLAIK